MRSDGLLLAALLSGACAGAALLAVLSGRLRARVPAPEPSRRAGLRRPPQTAGAPDLARDLTEIAAGLQAGLDFDQAAAALASRPPWSAYRGLRTAGAPVAEAAPRALGATSPELVSMLAVHSRYGGPLAGMLLLLADALEQERALAAELRAGSSEARATAYLLAALGPGLGLFMAVREPELAGTMLSAPGGALVMIAATGLWLAGVAVIRRLLRPLA